VSVRLDDRTIKVVLALAVNVTATERDDDRGTVWLRVGAVLAVLLLAGGAAGMMAESGPTADAVLDRVEERYDAAESYAGTAVLSATYENETTTKERSARAQFQYEAPGNYRVEVQAPEEYNGTVAATNGTVAWVQRPAGTTVVRPLNDTQQEWLDRVTVSAAVDRLEENASVSRRGTTTLDGEEVYVLDVTPDNESIDAGGTVWVDTDDYRVHQIRTEAQHNGTTLTATVRYESVTFGVSIHESTFQPPTDRSVVIASFDRTDYESVAAAREDVDFDVATAEPPAGFETGEVVAATQNDATTLSVTYTNETDRIAVVQSEQNPLSRIDAETETVTVNGHDAEYIERDEGGVVFWEADGLTYAVAGSVDKETLIEVASSLDA
jgi:outer membrane lipoprotein-sorting protein